MLRFGSVRMCVMMGSGSTLSSSVLRPAVIAGANVIIRLHTKCSLIFCSL